MLGLVLGYELFIFNVNGFNIDRSTSFQYIHFESRSQNMSRFMLLKYHLPNSFCRSNIADKPAVHLLNDVSIFK